jgi:hypothetical protein
MTCIRYWCILSLDVLVATTVFDFDRNMQTYIVP